MKEICLLIKKREAYLRQNLRDAVIVRLSYPPPPPPPPPDFPRGYQHLQS